MWSLIIFASLSKSFNYIILNVNMVKLGKFDKISIGGSSKKTLVKIGKLGNMMKMII